jgi:hypothetical protein
MTSTTRKPASQSLIGIKMLIIAVSLSGTLFGWAVLAAGQIRDALLNQTAPAVVQPSTNNNNPTQSTTRSTQPQQQQQLPVLRPITGQFQPSARSRSSR